MTCIIRRSYNTRFMRAVDMYPYVKANLRKRFPYEDGWIIRKLDKERADNPDFVVERRRKTRTDKVIVEVVADCKVTEEHLEALERHTQKFSTEGVRILTRIIVVCAGADTSLVPKDIDLMVLRSCEC